MLRCAALLLWHEHLRLFAFRGPLAASGPAPPHGKPDAGSGVPATAERMAAFAEADERWLALIVMVPGTNGQFPLWKAH